MHTACRAHGQCERDCVWTVECGVRHVRRAGDARGSRVSARRARLAAGRGPHGVISRRVLRDGPQEAYLVEPEEGRRLLRAGKQAEGEPA